MSPKNTLIFIVFEKRTRTSPLFSIPTPLCYALTSPDLKRITNEKRYYTERRKTKKTIAKAYYLLYNILNLYVFLIIGRINNEKYRKNNGQISRAL